MHCTLVVGRVELSRKRQKKSVYYIEECLLPHLQDDLGRCKRVPELRRQGRGLLVGEAVLAPVVGVARPAQAHRDPDLGRRGGGGGGGGGVAAFSLAIFRFRILEVVIQVGLGFSPPIDRYN